MKDQYIHIDSYGNKYYYSDKSMKVIHREDGPASEHTNGDKFWYINGELHREDGPAAKYVDGDKFWFLHDKRHRTDGPAAEYADGDKSWYINGEQLSEDEFNAKMNPVSELTLKQISEKFNIPLDQLRIKD